MWQKKGWGGVTKRQGGVAKSLLLCQCNLNYGTDRASIGLQKAVVREMTKFVNY
jgi:hypothetical protein